jgi:hypothetical protein
MTRPKGYAEWRPTRDTLAVLDAVRRILVEYQEHLPLTARQIFYRLVGQFEYPKTERAYKKLCNHLVRARRAEMISFSMIRDDGTVDMSPFDFASPPDFWNYVMQLAEGYRRERWQGQEMRLEVWCEAAGMAPQLAQIANPYGVAVYSTGGFSSVTVTHQIAERIAERGTPTTLLHIGDFDPSGESIFNVMDEDVGSFVRNMTGFGGMKDWFYAERVAVLREHIPEYDLPTAPPKPTDSRSRYWYDETCQAEALPPDVLAEMLRDAIERHVDLELMEEVMREEGDEGGKLENLTRVVREEQEDWLGDD